MSTFLAPIHYWLYHKIQLQEELISDIVRYADENGWNKCEIDLHQFEKKDLRPLDQLINLSNIHGWLQERIIDAESRYALLVSQILRKDPDRLDQLKEVARAFGEKHAVEKGLDAAEVYKRLDDVFLNGMPCDRVNVVTGQGENYCRWEQENDLHEEYWNRISFDPNVYYILRSEIMRGMLADAGFEMHSSDKSHYEIARAIA